MVSADASQEPELTNPVSWNVFGIQSEFILFIDYMLTLEPGKVLDMREQIEFHIGTYYDPDRVQLLLELDESQPKFSEVYEAIRSLGVKAARLLMIRAVAQHNLHLGSNRALFHALELRHNHLTNVARDHYPDWRGCVLIGFVLAHNPHLSDADRDSICKRLLTRVQRNEQNGAKLAPVLFRWILFGANLISYRHSMAFMDRYEGFLKKNLLEAVGWCIVDASKAVSFPSNTNPDSTIYLVNTTPKSQLTLWDKFIVPTTAKLLPTEADCHCEPLLRPYNQRSGTDPDQIYATRFHKYAPPDVMMLREVNVSHHELRACMER